MSAADDDGFVGQLWIIAFLNAGIKRVTIHMGDGQVEQFGMRYLAWAATRSAAGSNLIGG